MNKKKKFIWSMFAMMMVAMLSVGFASCGDDDNDGENAVTSNGKIIVDGNEYNVNYGYWDYDQLGGQGRTKYFLEFTETSFESGFQTGSGTYMQIQFYASGGSTLPTGNFTPTYVEVIAESEAYENKLNSDVTLLIEKTGETYTFTLAGKAAKHGGTDYSKDMTFTYKGKMTYMED